MDGRAVVDEMYSERELENERRLASIERKIDALSMKINDVILSQQKDHGKRLAALEQRLAEEANKRQWLMGWSAGIGAVLGFTLSMLYNYLR